MDELKREDENGGDDDDNDGVDDDNAGVDDDQWCVAALQCCSRVSHSFKQVTASQTCHCASTSLSLEKKYRFELGPIWSQVTASPTCHCATVPGLFLAWIRNLALN